MRNAPPRARDAGMTLLEMLIVVIVIGILAAIAIPTTIAQRRTAVDTRTTSDVRNLASWEAILVEQTNTGVTWATGGAMPVALAGFMPSVDTVVVASTNGTAWCVAGWAPGGNHDAGDDPIWVDSTNRTVSQTKPATASCDALVTTTTPPPLTGTPVAGTFAKAVYSSGAVTFTNAWTIAGIEADLYVGGDFSCNSNVRIYGKVTVVGNAYLTNTCRVDGDLWAGGTLTMDSTVVVLGNAQAGGDVTMTSSSRVGGDLRTNGSVTFSATPNVTGSVFARGPVSIANATTQHAGGDINTAATFTSNRDFKGRAFIQSVVVGGVIRENVTTIAVLTPPPPVILPPVPYMPVQWTGFDFKTWVQWLNANAITNNAPAWSAMRSASPGCTADAASYSLNGPLTVTVDTVIDARQVSSGCSKVTLQQVNLKMSADLVVYVDAFATVNGWTVTSTDGATHTLRVIVPGLTPECGSGRDITLGTGSQIAENVQTLLYSPARVHVAGTTELWGQLVGGCVSSDGQTTINYTPVTIPGWGG